MVEKTKANAAPETPAYPKEVDFALVYAGKFWDAGNLIVTLMFGLAFGVYYLASQHVEIRDLLQNYFAWIVVLAIVGNGGLWFLLRRLYTFEMIHVRKLTGDPALQATVWNATRARIGLLIFNTVMYLSIMTANWLLHVNSVPKLP